MNDEKPKTNLLVELARQRAAARSSQRFGVLGKDLASHFRTFEKPQPKIKRGGRNGSGKP